MKFVRRRLGWIITAIVVVGFIVISILPKPVEVEAVVVRRGLIQTAITAEGRIRLSNRVLITLPSTGTVSRITIEPGDSVVAGQVIATYTPPQLDGRQRDELLARRDAALALVKDAEERLRGLESLLRQAQTRSRRYSNLLQQRALAREQAEAAETDVERLQADATASSSRIAAAKDEVRAISAALMATPGQRLTITAPVSGIVFRRFEDMERPLAAGSPLLEIGTGGQQEVVIDVLSTDAVKVTEGMKVQLDGWGGDFTILARVRRVEPAARTKISALGVEEKRVDVIAVIDTVQPKLGDGYKVDASIITWENDRALAVPLSAVRRENGQSFVWVVDGTTSRRVNVSVGRRSSLMVDVVKGLSEGATVILHPPDQLVDGGDVAIVTP
ncbi:MAG TPA: efflux RND transporter periplasmic adaptor subunit [Chlorobiota bacterium]|nr:efflux RND transporter periplasmic adaptor subunit [Chlorobiota bacterium]